jgi:hypothetical protein
VIVRIENLGGMDDRGNRSTRRKPAPGPLCPPQIPLDQNRAAAVGNQRLTASAMARPRKEVALVILSRLEEDRTSINKILFL